MTHTIGFTPTWTDERIEKLKTLWSEGHSASMCAARLDVSRNAVIGKVHRMGLQKRGTPRGVLMYRLKPGRRRHRSETPKPKPKINTEGLAKIEALRALPDPVPKSAVTLMDLEPNHCRWPYGDPKRGVKFCGCEKVHGLSYCEKHAARAFSNPSPARIPLQEIAEKAEKVLEAAE